MLKVKTMVRLLLVLTLTACCLTMGVFAESKDKSDQFLESREYDSLVTNSNVNPDGSVAGNALEQEIGEKAMGITGQTIYIRLLNGRSVDSATLEKAVALGEESGNRIVLYSDTTYTDEIDIQGRMYVDTSKVSGKLKLGVYVEWLKTRAVSNLFQDQFNTKVAVIAMDQQGSFGTRLKIMAKVDLREFNKNNLLFYSYDASAGTYKRMTDPSYEIDDNKFLSLYTEQGGYIIIADKTLSS